MTQDSKPVPIPNSDSRTFWEATKRHELALQRCARCLEFRYFPRPICPFCLDERYDWQATSGKGQVWTYTVIHRAPSAAFRKDVPFVLAVVELAEGPRMMTNIIGTPPSNVYIGLPVEVVFEDMTEEITVPKFQPLAAGG